MPLLGAHMSIAGGYHKALEAAAELGMNACQLFTKNNNQWRAKPITDDEARRFRATRRRLGIVQAVSHASYLINLAAPDAQLWQKSVDAMVIELARAAQLGLSGVVVHPGAFTTSDEKTGIAAVARAIDEILSRMPSRGPRILLENTAGQGSCLGWRLEQLAAIIRLTKAPRRVAVCFDTCHAFAAGYPLSGSSYAKLIDALRRTVGLGRLRVIHLNDSARPLGSRVDRHAHIGRGQIGLDGFRHLLNDPRWARIPMLLETPKGIEGGQPLDLINLRTLRGLVRKTGAG
jgi:deoxyribonuclease-4